MGPGAEPRGRRAVDGSDLPAPQPSQAFRSSLAERLGRRDRLCANSPRCSRDAGWQRQLAPMLGQTPAEKKSRKGRATLPACRAGVPKSEVPILGIRACAPPTPSIPRWGKAEPVLEAIQTPALRDTPEPLPRGQGLVSPAAGTPGTHWGC